MVFRRFHALRLVFASIAALAVLLIIAVSPVSAGVYSGGNYNSCSYGTSCPAPAGDNQPQHTITVLPSGLQVAINLSDGQVITGKSYTVIITPLNGSGSSFNHFEFYLDGQLIHTGAPGENGTASWEWDTLRYSGSSVRIVVYDQDGQTTTQTFNIQLTTERSPSPSSPSGTAPPASGFLALVPPGVMQAIRQLPCTVVYAIPYALIALIALEAITLLLQLKRELREQRTLQLLLERERETIGMKRTFLQLASHYLRTPMTLLRGGVESLAPAALEASRAQVLQAAVEQMHQDIEGLIARSQSTSSADAVRVMPQSEAPAIRSTSVWRQVALLLPVALLGLLTAGFVYIANHVTEYSAGRVSVATQITLFIVLTLAIFQLLRRLQLRRADRRLCGYLLKEQQAIQVAEDNLIAEAASSLASHESSLNDLLVQLPDIQSTQFIRDGDARLQAVLKRFTIATKVRGSRCQSPLQAVQLADISGRLSPELLEAAAAKHTAISWQPGPAITCRDTDLLALVAGSLLDNAIEYSKDAGQILIGSRATSGGSELIVTDQGAGIANERVANIFQPFYKAEGAETFTHEGMGFSLYLDKLIMTYLGGGISLESQEDKGTTVVVSLPATQ